MDNDFDNLVYDIESIYDFALNTEIIQKDESVFKDLEKECQHNINYIKQLNKDKQYYFDKLNVIKDIAVTDANLYSQILEILDD